MARKQDSLPWFVVLSVALMALGFISGMLWPNHFLHALRPALEQLQHLSAVTGHSILRTVGVIFYHNVMAALAIVALGVFAGLFPAFEMWFNGLLVGFVTVAGATRLGVPAWKVFVYGMLPHGLFELPALIWASALGLQLGFAAVHSAMARLRRAFQSEAQAPVRSETMSLRREATRAVRQVPLIIGLLLLAACVEGIVTPKLIQWGLK